MAVLSVYPSLKSCNELLAFLTLPDVSHYLFANTIKYYRCCGEPIFRALSTVPEGKRRCFRSLKGDVEELARAGPR